MTRPVAACPNCSAPVEFRWSSAVQTVCGHCRSVVVRHDVDLKAVGVVADLPLSASPIQIGTRGRFQGDAFTVTGRIVYEYEHGTWNEWHVEFADTSSGWLSDAQAEYAVSRVVQKPASLPAEADLQIGQTYAFGDFSFQLTTLTRAAPALSSARKAPSTAASRRPRFDPSPRYAITGGAVRIPL